MQKQNDSEILTFLVEVRQRRYADGDGGPGGLGLLVRVEGLICGFGVILQ